MEENKNETPLSEVDSNVNAEETVVVNETESNGNTSEEQTVDNNAEQEAQELMNFNFEMLSDPNVLRAYRAARRVGERRQVSKKENKKKAPATSSERKKAKEELTQADGAANEEQIEELKTLCKTLTDKDETQKEFVQQIAMKTDGFTNIAASACAELCKNLTEIIAQYGE